MNGTTDRRKEILLETGTNELEIITFFLFWHDPASGAVKKTIYGINAAKIREMVAIPGEVTEVINSPACVQGVFMLRSNTIPLIDLCTWFHYDPERGQDYMKKWTVIVSEINGKLYGFVTHGVDKVYRVSWAQIQPPPALIETCGSLTGVCLVGDMLIQMVDFERIVLEIDPGKVNEKVPEFATLPTVPGQGEKMVVIVDDSRTIRRQMERILTEAGFKISAHPDGQAAWEFLEYLRWQGESDTVLAIISDIEMPRMDGHHLCLKIKEEPAFKEIPVLLFSSMINDALRRKGEKVGADAQITKLELHELVCQLSNCLEKKKKARG